MTIKQWRRWCGFSLRMAHRGYGLRSRRSRRKLADYVKEAFRWYWTEHLAGDDDLSPEEMLALVVDWDHCERHPMQDQRWAYMSSQEPPYICDFVDEMMEQWNPFYWDYGSKDYVRWDDLWGDRIRCCLRAGIDVAVEPSAGVLGFTAGDLRRMWRGATPPAWVTNDGKPWYTQEFTGVVPGFGLVPGKCEENGAFDTLPDEAAVWL